MQAQWDPDVYLARGDERARPFSDLMARVLADSPRMVCDLGCGPGNLTAQLPRRWPAAAVRGLDSSPEMVAAARELGVDAELGDVTSWSPPAEADVVVCNAVLQWVPGHDELLRRWVAELPPGAWLAMQVPGNFGAPSHVALRAVVDRPAWCDRLAGTVRDQGAVSDPDGYAELLTAAGCAVDAWETTYLHRLTGDDPVLEWLTGTALRPVRAVLAAGEWSAFCAELGVELRSAYPVRADGSTWLPFRRVFAVARTAAAADR